MRGWVAAVVGLGVQAVALVVATVVLVHLAVTSDGSSSPDASFGDAFFHLFGGVIYTVSAVVTGLLALVLLLLLALSVWRGGSRVTALIIGLVLQLPLAGYSVAAWDNGVGLGETTVLVGAVLVVVAALFPATWRGARRPPVVDRCEVRAAAGS